jgi:F-type H+-transporting ATPase subunit gamma
MKMVAAAKLRRAQERIFMARPLAYSISRVITNLRQHVDPSAHPLFETRDEPERAMVVVVTADRGLAGGFNHNIIRVAEELLNTEYADLHARRAVSLVCVGRKGHDHFSKRGHALVGNFSGAFDRLDFQLAKDVVDIAVNGFRDGRWDEVRLVYNEFKNTISQNRVSEPLLPVPTERFLTPVMETEEYVLEEAHPGSAVDYIFEPAPHAILDALVPKYLAVQVWRALLESNAAEQGARMVAMDNATANADDLLRELRIRYNRARQDAITKELIEITSGADALGG